MEERDSIDSSRETVYLKFGNYLRRVAVENVRPDARGEEVIEEGYIEPDQDSDRFAEIETPVEEMEADLDMAELVRKLKKENEELSREKNEIFEKYEKEIPEKKIHENVDTAKVSNIQETNPSKEEVMENRKHKRKLQKEKKQHE